MWSAMMAVVLLVAEQPASPARPAYLPGAPTAKRPAQGLELRREPGKGWVYEHAGFVARVSEDGEVRFDDRHGNVYLALPIPLPMPEGTATLEGSLRKLVNPRARPRPPAATPESPSLLPSMSPDRPDPLEWCRYPHPATSTPRCCR